MSGCRHSLPPGGVFESVITEIPRCTLCELERLQTIEKAAREFMATNPIIEQTMRTLETLRVLEETLRVPQTPPIQIGIDRANPHPQCLPAGLSGWRS